MTFIRKRQLPSIERIREQVSYNKRSGILRWRVSRRGVTAGKIAGHFNPSNGYWFVRIDGALIRSHRLAWAWVKGYWPEDEIDHRDRDRGNCRWSNLREATRVQNAANMTMSPKNTTGIPGVSLTTSKRRYRAEIRIARKRIHLGYFDTVEAAGVVRREAEKKYRGEFA